MFFCKAKHEPSGCYLVVKLDEERVARWGGDQVGFGVCSHVRYQQDILSAPLAEADSSSLHQRGRGGQQTRKMFELCASHAVTVPDKLSALVKIEIESVLCS